MNLYVRYPPRTGTGRPAKRERITYGGATARGGGPPCEVDGRSRRRWPGRTGAGGVVEAGGAPAGGGGGGVGPLAAAGGRVAARSSVGGARRGAGASGTGAADGAGRRAARPGGRPRRH